MKQLRHILVAQFGHLYFTKGNIGDPCTYCGRESSGFDHVPPLHFASRLPVEERSKFEFRLLPCCRQCNSWLAGTILTTARERRATVRRHLLRKYARVLRIPQWDEAELSQLSEKLATDVRKKLKLAGQVRELLAWEGYSK